MPEASDQHSAEIKWSGRDEIKLKSMVAYETLGRPYRYELLLLCEKPDLRFDDLVGKTMTVVYTDRKDDTVSHFHGFVCDFVQSDADNETATSEGQLYGYRATLVPWLWLLTRSQDCKIFQKKKLPDIVKQVCQDAGFTDFSDGLTASYDEFEYTVQYRESNFNFVSRLLEREGIYYFFEHEENKHTLKLVDSSTGHSKAGAPELPFRAKDDSRTEEEEPVREWRIHKRVQPVEFQYDDYDFEHPTADLFSKSKISKSHGHADGVVYDYPGRYLKTSQGKTYAQINIERLQARHEIVSGKTVCQHVRAGQVFKLKEHPRSDQNREYLVIESRVSLHPEMYGIGDTAGAGQRGSSVYECEFKAIDLQVPFRPEKITPQPVVHGPQTAVVVGPSGDEIHTDKYGRIKVQFHWDRVGEKNENSSCFIRVAQSWAGKKWGFIQIPRIGQEVMVEFLEGDPDRPIVTGVVYNADLMPPYELPGNATQSGLKTRSSKEGNDDTFNELRFEDKKDEEEVYFHAEKNFNRVVENNDTLKIGQDKKDKGDRTVEVWNNETYTIGAGEGQAEDGSHKVQIWKDRTVTLKEGDDTLKVEKGKLLIDVAEEITLKCGKSVLVMKKDGTITVDGKDLKQTMSKDFKVKANSNVNLEAVSKFSAKSLQTKIEGQAKLDLKAPMASLSGDAMAKIKGGMVMIN